ncbi:MAG: class I SAM-dependent methyltransferase [Chthoniobacterales bacterium]
MEAQYTGVEILEALEHAENYNGYLVRLIRDSADAKTAVDFGAGVGTFARRLREEGFSVICIEADLSQRERLTRDGFEAFADVESLPQDSAPFIFSMNVFEHIRDDKKALQQLHEKLQPGGVLLVYVPAFQCLWSSLDDKVCHYRRYTKDTLERLVRGEGLIVERVEYVDSLGFIVAFAFRLLRLNAEALTPSAISIYDRWIFPPSRVLDIIFRRFFGKNLFIVCRKAATDG